MNKAERQERDAQVVGLRSEGVTFEEIADLVGCSVGTARGAWARHMEQHPDQANNDVAVANADGPTGTPDDVEIDDGDLSEASLPALAMFANNRHAEALAGQQTALQAAWRAGNALLAAKAKCKHGTWMDWVKRNFHGSHDTANAYMKLAKSERAQNLDPQTSIRKALAAICEPDPKIPATSNPFLKPFYADISAMTTKGIAVTKVMASAKWPEHQHEVFTEHGDYIRWNQRNLADTLTGLLAEEPPTGPTEGEKARRAGTHESLATLRDAIDKYLAAAGAELADEADDR